MVALLGCAACGRGFFNPDPQFQDAAVAGSDTTSQGPPIQFAQAAFANGSATQEIFVFLPLAQHAGATLVVAATWDASSISGVSDQLGDSFQAAIGPLITSNGHQLEIFYASNVLASASGQNVVVIACSGLANMAATVVEYTNVDRVQPLDAAVGKIGANGGVPSSGILHASYDGELLVGAVTSESTLGSLPGYSLRQQANTFLFADLQAPTSGDYAAIADEPSSSNWIVTLVGLRRAN